MKKQLQNLSHENSAAVRAAEVLGQEPEYLHVGIRGNHGYNWIHVKMRVPDGVRDEVGRLVDHLVMDIPFPPAYHTENDEVVLNSFRGRIRANLEGNLQRLGYLPEE